MVVRRSPKEGRHAASPSRSSRARVSRTPASINPRLSSPQSQRMDFASAKKSRRASRSDISTFVPDTSSRESKSQHSRRMNQMGRTQAAARKSRVKSVLLALICVVCAVGLALFVGSKVLVGGIDKKNALSGDAKDALSVPEKEATDSYTLFAVDLDAPELPKPQDGPDLMLLLRADKEKKTLSYIMIPSNVSVSLSDRKEHPLREAQTIDGDAGLIEAVGNFADVRINHYVKADSAGLVSLVDALGGVNVSLSEDIDDPDAGCMFIEKGEQSLSGEAALEVLRALNFAGGFETQALNRVKIANALVFALMGSDSSDASRLMDKVAGSFQTDVGMGDFKAFADAFRNGQSVTVYASLVPGYINAGDTSCYFVQASDWAAMMERMKAGEDPNAPSDTIQLDRSTVTVIVRNGSGSPGAAAALAETLKGYGYRVEDTGNANASVYEETLVVCKDSDHQMEADMVISDIHCGRCVVDNTGFYEFDTDVLVIIGTDWMNYA